MNKRTLLYFAGSMLTLVSCMVHGQTNPPSYSPWSPQTWLTRPWTGNDKPYQEIRENIEATVLQGTSPQALAQQYKEQSQKNHLDAKAQFAWAYTAHEAFLTHTGASFADASALDALSTTGVENVYEYTRLRFMLTQEVSPNTNNMYLKILGERLLKRNPNDKRVRQDLVYALCTDKRGLTEALHIAQDGIKRLPNDYKMHATVASVYESVFNWSKGRDNVAKANAIAEYKKYLQLAPQNDYYRRQATLLVNLLPQEKPW